MLSAIYPADSDAGRTTKYNKHIGELNFKDIIFKVKATDFTKFECQNQSLSVIVFGWDEGLYPI